MSRNTVIYAAAGPNIVRYGFDGADGTLSRQDGEVAVPANVQYACVHASGAFLYVASSDRAPGGLAPSGDTHHVSVFHIAPGSGALTPHGSPFALPWGPIHISTDAGSRHLLVAYVNPPGLDVFRLQDDGSVGEQVPTPADLDAGIVPHEVTVAPGDRQVILVTRGHDAEPAKAEEPGGLKVFQYDHGVLSNEVSVAPNGGYGFGPRNLEFHPTKPWVYVSLERQNELQMFCWEGAGLAAVPAFTAKTLRDPAIRTRQLVGAVHLHPSARFAYVANRASHRQVVDGHSVMVGEDTIAVFALDEAAGEPRLIQHADTHGSHCRTFQIDPTGRWMVCAHIAGRAGEPPGLTVFEIADDGRLAFARAYPIETGAYVWWMGMTEV